MEKLILNVFFFNMHFYLYSPYLLYYITVFKVHYLNIIVTLFYCLWLLFIAVYFYSFAALMFYSVTGFYSIIQTNLV